MQRYCSEFVRMRKHGIFWRIFNAASSYSSTCTKLCYFVKAKCVLRISSYGSDFEVSGCLVNVEVQPVEGDGHSMTMTCLQQPAVLDLHVMHISRNCSNGGGVSGISTTTR